jgi:uncharacterized membrane protein (UPF0127 family)
MVVMPAFYCLPKEQIKVKTLSYYHLGLFLWLLSPYTSAAVDFGTARVKVAELPVLTVELAANDSQRARGLMYRDTLCENCGMLFDFGETRYVGMWMKNTFIPLSVAYFTQDGVIVNIRQMQPQTLQSHPSDAPVRFALEMPMNWFKNNNIHAGDRIRIISMHP